MPWPAETAPIFAEEKGLLIGLLALRSQGQAGYRGQLMGIDGVHPFPWDWYWYDTFGAVLILLGASGRTHVHCHPWAKQLWYGSPIRNFDLQESAAEERFPCFWLSNIKEPIEVEAGARIGSVGNAGYSFGLHLHYEVHADSAYLDYRLRPDPKTLYPAEWAKHERDLAYNWKAEAKRWEV